MGIIVDEDFTEYSVGQTFPVGIWQHGSTGQILGIGVPPSSPPRSASPSLSGVINTFTGTGPNSGVQQPNAYFSWFQAEAGGFQPVDILQLSNRDPNNLASGFVACALLQELDGSLSLLGNGLSYLSDATLGIANSGSQSGFYLMTGIWYFIQLSTVYGTDIGTGQMSNSSTLYVDGVQVATGGGLLGVIPSSTFLKAAQSNQWSFNSGLQRGVAFGNVSLCSGSVGQYPHPSYPPTAVNARISQSVIETLNRPTSSNARVSQAVIETLNRPTASKARVSQIVIELLTKANPPSGRSPEYIKRHNLSANS